MANPGEYILRDNELFPVLDAEFNPTWIIMGQVGTPTYKNLDDMTNNYYSAGRVSGGTITSDGDGTVTVAAGTYYFKKTDSHIGALVSADIAEAGLTPTDSSLNYAYADYNSGSPQYAITTDLSAITHTTQFVIGLIRRDSNMLHIANIGQNIDGFMHNTYMHEFTVAGLERASGLVTTEGGTDLSLSITAGQLSWALQLISVSAYASSTTDFTYYYNDGAWQSTTTDVLNDSQYNDYGTGLANLTANRYGAHWVYMMVNGNVHVVYGVGDYTLAQAEAAQPPSNIPAMIADAGILVAKVIIQKEATDFYEVELPWDVTFTGTGAGDHGNLAGLGDDDHTQYVKHSLSTAEKDFLIGSGSNTWIKNTLAEVGAILETDLDHGNIQGLTDDDHSQYVLADGTRTITGDLTVQHAGDVTFSVIDSTNSLTVVLKASDNSGYCGTTSEDEFYLISKNTIALTIDTTQRVTLATGLKSPYAYLKTTYSTYPLEVEGADRWSVGARFTTTDTGTTPASFGVCLLKNKATVNESGLSLRYIDDNDQAVAQISFQTLNRTGPVGRILAITNSQEKWYCDSSNTMYWIGADSAWAGNLNSTGSLALRQQVFPGWAASTGAAYVECGGSRTSSGYAYVDLIGDTTYTDYGLRLLRANTGANAVSQLLHRGTGTFTAGTVDAATFSLLTANTARLVLDSSGRMTNAYQPSFSGFAAADTNIAVNSSYDIVWVTNTHDVGNHMDSSTGIYTCPVAGKYQCHLQVWVTEVPSDITNLWVTIDTSSQDKQVYLNPTHSGGSGFSHATIDVHHLVNCSASDTIKATFYQQGGSTNELDILANSSFSIALRS